MSLENGDFFEPMDCDGSFINNVNVIGSTNFNSARRNKNTDRGSLNLMNFSTADDQLDKSNKSSAYKNTCEGRHVTAVHVVDKKSVTVKQTTDENYSDRNYILTNIDDSPNESKVLSKSKNVSTEDAKMLSDISTISSSLLTDSVLKRESSLPFKKDVHSYNIYENEGNDTNKVRIVQNLSKSSSVSLSPMSKSGDLMGMSPITTQSNRSNSQSPGLGSTENDLLSDQQELERDNTNILTVSKEDDEFKSPAEIFKDPAALDYLLKIGNSENKFVVPTRDFGRESLFVKFDPLVRLPTGIRTDRVLPECKSKVAADASKEIRVTEKFKSSQLSDKLNMSSDELNLKSSPTNQSADNISKILSNSSMLSTDKPIQIVAPAKNTRQLPSQNTPMSTKTTTSASPAAVIDRLINLGINTPPAPAPPVQPKKTLVNSEYLKELQSVKDLLSSQDSELQQVNEKISILQKQVTESNLREEALLERINEKTKNHKKMSMVMEEYERTMSQLLSEREADKKKTLEERATLLRERNEVTAHLANTELSFNDTHLKYERCKSVIQTYKTNEDLLKQTVAKQDENLKKQMERYDQLRQHAMTQLEKANQEIETIKKTSHAEIVKYQAMLKKSEIQISSLEESLAQKTKNCEKLTAICDELINKVG